jgi:hypothetical protein
MSLQAADLPKSHTYRDSVESNKGNVHSDAVWLARKELPKVVDDTCYENDLSFTIRGLR